jgi:hypothetical protein
MIYIQHYFFLKCLTKQSGCILWAGASYRLGNTVYKEELDGLYHSLDIITVVKSRRVKWLGCVGQNRNAHWGLPGEPDAARLRGKSSCRWRIMLM